MSNIKFILNEKKSKANVKEVDEYLKGLMVDENENENEDETDNDNISHTYDVNYANNDYEYTSDNEYSYTHTKYSDGLDIGYNKYSVKELCQILNFYNIKKNKMRKEEIINKILLFEEDIENISIVLECKRLFHNLLELKEHSFLINLLLI